MNNKIIAAIGAGALIALMAVSVSAGDTVTATVTPEQIAVSVDVANFDYGILSVSASDGSRTTALSGTITATNDGNVNENFNIKGTSTANWTLNSSPASTGTVAADQFVHRFDADATFTDGTANALSTTNQALGAAIVPSNTQQFELQMNMPTSSAVTTQQSTTVTVVATAS